METIDKKSDVKNQYQTRNQTRESAYPRRTTLSAPGGIYSANYNRRVTGANAGKNINAGLNITQIRRRSRRIRAAQRVWRGFLSLTASVVALLLSSVLLINHFRPVLDDFFGTSSFLIVSDADGNGDFYSYPSDYANTTELVKATANLSERISAEGIVLLKNNGALPLSSSEKSKISLLGFSSYHPVTGGVPGTGITPNYGTDADTVDFIAALKQRGFDYNPALETLYANLFYNYSTEIPSREGGVTITSPAITAPSNSPGAVFSNREPDLNLLDQSMPGWRESLESYSIYIITIARGGSQDGNYTPGSAGVDRNSNQRDPLSLTDAERRLIQAAADARDLTGGKLIILLNTSNPMEIQELVNNGSIDAILQIGFPGGYGFYALCDILDGTVNPSGHLSDTWAVNQSLSPAAQNCGFVPWERDNIDPENYINSAIIQAESIYTGYKYYETRYFDSVLNAGNANSSVGSVNGGPWIYNQEIIYPFGYGLSYTTFAKSLDSLDINLSSGIIRASVTVSNIGGAPGRDAVQFYASVPYTDYDKQHGIEKSAIQLLDYAKTNILSPGQSETIEFSADLNYLASWDSDASNAVNTRGCYILDPGTYYFTIGDDAHDAVNHVLQSISDSYQDKIINPDGVSYNHYNYYYNQTREWIFNPDDIKSNQAAFSYLAYTKNHTPVRNQLLDLDFNYWIPGTIQYLSRADWENTFPRTYSNLGMSPQMREITQNNLYTTKSSGSDISFGVDHGLKLYDLKNISDLDDPRWQFLSEQITLEDALLQSGFGGTPRNLTSISAPAFFLSDGPNGISSHPLGYAANYNNNQDPCAIQPDDPNGSYQAGVLPCACIIAQTFNQNLSEEIGRLMGNYSLWANIPIWQGVMTNLHRTPYNARNYDSYSEDPVLSALQAAATVRGAKDYGLIIAPGNLFFQDSQADRLGAAVFMTEQKARECELRAAQACFEKSNALAAVTAPCRAGVYTINSHPNLIHDIIRGEWGFKGILAENSAIADPVYATLKEAVLNGVTMTGIAGSNAIDAVSAYYDYWTVQNIQKDPDLTAALQQTILQQSYALANSNAMDGEISHTRLSLSPVWYDYITWLFIAIFAFLSLFNILQYIRAADKLIDSPVRRRIPAAGLRDIIITALFSCAGIAACLLYARSHFNFTFPDLIFIILLGAAAILSVIRIPMNWNNRPGFGDLLPIFITIFLAFSFAPLALSHIQEAFRLFHILRSTGFQNIQSNSIILLSAFLFPVFALLFALSASFRDVTEEL